MPKYRSSWENSFCYFLDHEPRVTKWCFECCRIPYRCLTDGQIHTYITDFYFEEVDNNNRKRKFIVEVKPLKQLKPPRNTKRKRKKTYLYEQNTYLKNASKWTAAEQFCNKHGFEFRIVCFVKDKNTGNMIQRVFKYSDLNINING
ncbi:MAG: TnsA endonuclease N-terminal domain-containing protein, partial [Nanoarchaeota archaeon]